MQGIHTGSCFRWNIALYYYNRTRLQARSLKHMYMYISAFERSRELKGAGSETRVQHEYRSIGQTLCIYNHDKLKDTHTSRKKDNSHRQIMSE